MFITQGKSKNNTTVRKLTSDKNMNVKKLTAVALDLRPFDRSIKREIDPGETPERIHP